MFKTFFKFIASIFSEENGQGSYSRFAAGAIVLATLAWVSHVVWKTHSLPDLTGATAFLTVSAGSHYGLNQASNIISSIRGTVDPAVTATVPPVTPPVPPQQ